jgi:membrane protein implicated in regulation of membrane protease activity
MEYSAVAFWVSVSVVLLALEALAVAGIGFLYAGLSALSVAFLIAFELIPGAGPMEQLAHFLILSGIWAGLLWVPMRRLLKKTYGAKGYNNMEGVAVVDGEDMCKGRPGKIRWSGTYMNAVIHPEERAERIAAGSSVRIVKTDGNVAYVKRSDGAGGE